MAVHQGRRLDGVEKGDVHAKQLPEKLQRVIHVGSGNTDVLHSLDAVIKGRIAHALRWDFTVATYADQAADFAGFE